ncbi:unnamed protein product [Amoebophrya sp. A120]|nr:unnamed protein product [Amoebophrya sp. A120]|eukprot:GSA120T00011067001.1
MLNSRNGFDTNKVDVAKNSLHLLSPYPEDRFQNGKAVAALFLRRWRSVSFS